jgi:hypothetical protein
MRVATVAGLSVVAVDGLKIALSGEMLRDLVSGVENDPEGRLSLDISGEAAIDREFMAVADDPNGEGAADAVEKLRSLDLCGGVAAADNINEPATEGGFTVCLDIRCLSAV